MKQFLLSLIFLSFIFTTASSQVVISEVYGGGGNAGSIYKNDFIELYNPGSSAIDLTGWSVQYASATGNTWQKTALAGSIPAKGYYLIQQAAGTGGTTALPTPDATGTLALAGAAGKVALCNNNIALTGFNPSGSSVIDFVGFGTTANFYEGFGTTGAGPTPAPSNSLSVERKANSSSTSASMSTGGADEFTGNGFDSNFNNADFVTRPAQPQNSASATEQADVAPTASAFSPADNSVNIALNTNPSITFSETIVKGTAGNITVKNITDGSSQVIGITSADAVISGSTLTLSNVTLLNSKSYAISIDATAIKDATGNFFAGIADETTWNFSTVPASDITPPTASVFNPVNSGISTNLSLAPSISFSENIQKGTGNIIVYNLTAGTSQTVNVTSPSVTVSNNILTIGGLTFDNKSNYAVQVDAGAITDLASTPNSFAGIADNTTWSFSFNVSPLANNDIFSLFNDGSFNGSLASNDSDPNALTLTYSKLTDPAQGTISLNANGTFTYVPASGYTGVQTFSYRVTNSDSYNSDATVTLNISEKPKLIISQYYEGGGTNKWIELTNLSATDINTASAQLELALYNISGDAGNISNFTSATTPSQKAPLNVTIPAYGSVLIGNTGNQQEIPYLTAASANQSINTVINFNGNDGVALLDGSNTIIDAFGQGINAKDASYVRNLSVTGPIATFNVSDWTRQTLPTVQDAEDTDDPNRLGVHLAPNLPACISPVNAATALNFTAVSHTSLSGNFTAAAGTSDYLVIRTTDNTLNATPADGTVYAPGSALGNGTVVSNGPATSFNASALANGTTYYFHIYSYNNTACAGGPLYLTAQKLEGNSATTTPQPCVVPASQPTSFTVTSSSYNYIQGSFTQAVADEYLVLMSTSNSLSLNPVNGTEYVPGESVGNATVIKRGAGNTFQKTGLAPATNYYFYVFALNSDCGNGPVYQTANPLKGNKSTSTASAGNLNFYYGNLHAHSSSSDGNKDDLSKKPIDDYAFAKTAMHMDFLGISEHNHTGAGMDLADWKPGVDAARASTTSTFVGMYGMEWGTISGGGHVLVYGIDSLIGWEPNQNQIYVPKSTYTGNTGLFKIVNRHGNNAISMLAHPNNSDYNNLADLPYDANADLAIVGSAVESGPAFSTNVTYSDPSKMNYLSYFNKMLSKGYHMGPSIDHDNHNFTFGKTAKSRLVVLAPTLSESELLNSLKQMRFYATEDFGAQVTFTINNQPLGTVMTAANVPNISVNTITTNPVDSIRIFYGVPGSGIDPVKLTLSTSASLTYTDNALANLSTGYYYADIIESDGTRTITSPIWYTRDDNTPPVKSNQNISFSEIADKTYGDADFDPAASSDNAANAIIYSSSNTDVATIVDNKVHILKVGTVTITANQAGNTLYNDAVPQSQTFSITAKPLTVTADAKTKVYGETDAALTFSLSSSLVAGDSFTGSLSRVAGENVGTYAISQGDLALSSNYILSFQPSALSITAKPLTVTADAKTKVYGETDAALTFSTSSALVAGDSFTGSLSRDAGENVGSYAISQGDLALNSNYILSFQPSALTISVKPLTVSANAQTKVYGAADPALTYSLSSDLANGDIFTGMISRVAGEKAGTYEITQGDLSLNSNYALSFQGADFTIAQKALTITAENKTRFQGTANPEFTLTYNGFVNNEGPAVLTTPAAASTSANSSSLPGDYAISVSAATATNYNISFTNGILTIKPSAPTSLNLQSSIVFENQNAGTSAGQLSSGSDDPNASFTYSLVSGAGDADNSKFKILGNILQTSQSLDFESKQAYSIRLRSTTQYGFSLDKVFAVQLSDVNEAPTMNAAGNQAICYTSVRQSVFLSGITAGPENNQSTTLSVSSSNPNLFTSLTIAPGSNGNAEIRYTLKNNASATATITVVVKDNGGTANGGQDQFSRNFNLTVNNSPVVSISSNRGIEISKGQKVDLTASGGTNYIWAYAPDIQGGQNTAVLSVRPKETTTYKVIALTPEGCSTEQSITLYLKDDYKLEASNIITPNGDGKNDLFVIQNIDYYPNNIVKIFDRGGRLVYSKQSYNNDWNGTLNGAPLAEDTYYYIVDFGAGLGQFKGSISIIRN